MEDGGHTGQKRSEGDEARLHDLDEALSIVMHELKNPLAIMQGFATTLVHAAEAMDPEAVVQAAKAVERGAKRMDALLSVLRESHSYESGQMSLLLKDTLVSDLLREVADNVRTIAPNHSIELLIEDDVLVRVDNIRIQQVLINLLSNALKFSPPHSQVRVSVARRDDIVTISVEDEGAGIPQDRVEELFKKFSRLGSTEKGTGLGLYLSRAIARAHGGDLSLGGPEGGSGCRFVLQLPIHGDEERLPTYRQNQPR